jgi:hypothetical protein
MGCYFQNNSFTIRPVMSLKTFGVDILKILLITCLIFIGLFGMFLGAMTGDCGFAITFKDVEFYLAIASILGFPAILLCISLMSAGRAFFQRRSLLESAAEIKRFLKVASSLAIIASLICYAYMAVNGTHTRCGLSIGF